MDQKRHLEVGCSSSILRRILICEVNNKVWTQGQSEAPLILEKSNVNSGASFGNGIRWKRSSIKGRICTCHTVSHPPVCSQHTPEPSSLSTIKKKKQQQQKKAAVPLQTNLQLHQSTSTGTESINDIPGLTCHAKLMQCNLYETAGGWIIALLLR